MSSDPYRTVLENLPRLLPDQRKGVEEKLRALKALDGPADKTIRAERYDIKSANVDDFLFEGIFAQLSSMGLVNLSAKSSLRQSKAYRVYSFKLPPVMGLLMAIKDLPQTPASRLSLGRLSGRCLATHIASWTTVSPQLMLVNVDKIPEAIDRQFPGYMANGILAQLLLRPTGSAFKLSGKSKEVP